MVTSNWIYDKTTNRFLYGGPYEPTFDAVTQGLARLTDRDPDLILERYDATAPTWRRLATQTELDAEATAQRDREGSGDIARRATKATVVWTLKRLLGRNPTVAEIGHGRARNGSPSTRP